MASDSDSDPENYVSSTSSSSENDDDNRRYTRSNSLKATTIICSKLSLPEHLAAYLEEREIVNDIVAVACSQDLLDNVFGNYVIVKNILSYLCWQDKLMARSVCHLWNSIVNRLQNEQLAPVDFSINLGFQNKRKGLKLLKSSEFYTEPLAVFTFCNSALNLNAISCQAIEPSPCKPACDKGHNIIDIIHHEAAAPSYCMYAVRAYNMSYMSIPQSITIENMIHKPLQGTIKFFCGVSIPKIPGVEFKIINISGSNNILEVLIPQIKKLTACYVVKGVITCLTDNYLFYVDDQNAQCLEFLHSMQPGIPFAFGGCLVEDTANTSQDIAAIIDCANVEKEFVSGNIISLGLFLTPKEETLSPNETVTEPKHKFEIYSHVIASTVWSKGKIQEDIKEFSEQVPRFEHSVALKFSCMGRQQKHETEQNSFRQYFPNTRLVGCFGNGELGINHPKKTPRASLGKRFKDTDQPYEKVHSYSTVFFYMGWGKVTEEAVADD